LNQYRLLAEFFDDMATILSVQTGARYALTSGSVPGVSHEPFTVPADREWLDGAADGWLHEP
jgi:hypothetical protein